MAVRNRLWGTPGNDVLTGSLVLENVIYADAGDDRLTGGNLADTLVGEAGSDRLYGSGGNDGMWGGGGNDHLYGGSGTDYLAGDGGDDLLNGGAGADLLFGSLGNDTYFVDDPGDRVVELAGQGTDSIIAFISWTLSNNAENLILRGAAVTGRGNALNNAIVGSNLANTIDGGDGNDRLTGADGDDVIAGDAGGDALNGGAGRDQINGGSGNDGVWGGGGNDTIFGGDGNDRLFGDGGNDMISGGRGADVMTGGQFNGLGLKGADTYVWHRTDLGALTGAFDRITDFTRGDRLDFSLIFTMPPVSIASVVRTTGTGAGTVISLDIGGGTYADIVRLDGIHVTLGTLISDGAFII